MENLLEWIVDKTMAPLAIICLVAFIVLLAAIPVVVYKDLQQPKFELNKADWQCLQWDRRMVGKVIVNKCVLWGEK